MRLIEKASEPASLARHRLTPGATYDGLPTATKDEVRTSLVREQGYLCCYCMGRVRDDALNTKIEHWAPRRGNSLDLTYSNLLAACRGGEGLPFGCQHCDTRKGDRTIHVDPRAPSAHPRRLRYLGDGRVTIDDPAMQLEIDAVLNLNTDRIVANRRDALTNYLETLRRVRGSGSTWPRSALQRAVRELEQLDADGALIPYVQVILYWLHKRLGSLPAGPGC